ncbi:MAG: hypothetical protein NDI60_00705 [Elusimicrobiales bacterium]|nr:hypothetical protein [Elusimicrobiales bacterium]
MPAKIQFNSFLAALLAVCLVASAQAFEPSQGRASGRGTVKAKARSTGLANTAAPAQQEAAEMDEDEGEELTETGEEQAQEAPAAPTGGSGFQGAAGPKPVLGQGSGNVKGGGGSGLGAGESQPKAQGKTGPIGNYAALMNRPPYVGSAEMPCRWGPPQGRCTHEGKPLAPPPTPDGFEVLNINRVPLYPGTNHHAFPLRGHKLALKFKAVPSPKRFRVHFDSPNGFVARSAMDMWVAISDRPGDYDVPKECIVLPDMLSNGWAGGAAHSVAQIEVSIGPTTERGVCALKADGSHYYVNVAGDCSRYWSSATEYNNAVAAGCVTDLININGWMTYLAP